MIDPKDKAEIAEALSRMLADSYRLYVKTHGFHWNVTGPRFHSLHAMFEEQYTDLATAVDEIAERIRALGITAPGSMAEFSRLSELPEAESVPDENGMLRELAEGQDIVVRSAHAALKRAEKAGDEVTVDLMIARMHVHEKNAWMLRSSIG